MRVVITGGSGRLGSAMARAFASAHHPVVTLGHADLDITRPDLVRTAVARLAPDVIINCCAYNAVDAAEADPASAYAVNARGPAALAAAAADSGAVLVHFSSDFVFDGDASTPYREDAHANPISVYGASKLAGEDAVRTLASHYILRVSSLFGGRGTNGHRATIDYIAGTLLTGGTVRAQVDRWVTPSYVPDVTETTRLLVERGAPYGTYHCVSSGAVTWYDLAVAIARRLGVPAAIQGVTAAELKPGAPRPRFCALANDRLRSLGVPVSAWEASVARHLAMPLPPPPPEEGRKRNRHHQRQFA